MTLLHYGSIVVGQRNRIGNYAIVFHASCMVDDGSVIGDGLFMATGAVISKQLVLGDAVNVAANSVLAQSCPDGHVTFAGAPANQVKENPQPWYAGIWGSDTRWLDRVSRVEASDNNSWADPQATKSISLAAILRQKHARPILFS